MCKNRADYVCNTDLKVHSILQFLCLNWWTSYLEVAKDIYKEVKDGPANVSLRPPGEKHVLDPEQRDEDEGGSHSLHVGCGLGTVSLPQLGDENSDNVQEEE